ncbi:class I SAM-dependent methyltransferase [Halegenticoccus soli]|uniref:class I SAM-dependent methyltransferase n=1 Tax=Halegenticoccus soli TaxID=1985678 RepID=UPI000C6E4E24|nr:methyltransferase domain-containing protein [Halegenticoccus soli]
MRRFSAEYLSRTRDGMWADSRAALSDLELPTRERVLDVGCGTGELSRVLAAEAGPDCEAYGLDADPSLLRVARGEAGIPAIAGDATRLPFPDDSFDLVVCQALLVNLPDPAAAVREFARVSSDLVAAIEPDNGDVGVDSTVDREVALERRVRAAYLRGVRTDVALGGRVAELFDEAGLSDVRTRRYHHRKLVEPPYDERELESAKRKATGAGIADHEAELRRALPDAAYDDLRRRWREMGRSIVEQMRERAYRRAEVVPFDVTVGRV